MDITEPDSRTPSEHNGNTQETIRNASALNTAVRYIRRGWNPVPVRFKEKVPTGNDWQRRTITEQSAPQFFTGEPQNIGVILGPTSGGLTDVDLDAPEAIAVAPYLRPETHAVFGRAGKPESHYLYVTNLAETVGQAALKFQDP